MSGEQVRGKVCRLLVEKQFGFIRVNNDEYFFHKADYLGHWEDLVSDYPGLVIEVEFTKGMTDKGPRARNVSRIDYPNQAV